ncbi:MAG: efflux RND transporter periplasmic adaptor subunit [Nitrospirae bacterium]|nr:efflux RND transporter periplasmic adaptor subunit [Nitrospirota bacterium]
MKKAAIFIIVLSLLLGCEKKQPPKEEAKDAPRTCKVAFQKVQTFIEATGSVAADLEGGAKILSPLAGSVEKIFVKIGDSVKKGTPLAVVRSADVSDAYSSHLSTEAQLKQAERIYNLNKQLFEIGAVTKNDLLNSEAGYEQARAMSEGLRKKLDIYGTAQSGASADKLVLSAPIDGRVADIAAHIGDRFDTATPLMVVANPKKLLVVANIYDTDIPKIQKDSEVTFSIDIFPNTQFKGTVFYMSDVEELESRTIKTYIRVATGSTGLFKQNMFLKLKIFDGEKTLPVVPKTAMIYKENKFYVNAKDNTTFALKEVKPVRDASEKLMAVEGLKEGDEIVCSAIDMEKT